MVYTQNIIRMIKYNEMGGECGKHGGHDRYLEGFGGETWGKEATWKTHA